jgi:hypothetical protein
LARLNPYTVITKNGARMNCVTARNTFPEGETAPKKPWSTPTVEEIPWDTVPIELRMLALGLPVPVMEPEPMAMMPKPAPEIRPEDLPF